MLHSFTLHVPSDSSVVESNLSSCLDQFRLQPIILHLSNITDQARVESMRSMNCDYIDAG